MNNKNKSITYSVFFVLLHNIHSPQVGYNIIYVFDFTFLYR